MDTDTRSATSDQSRKEALLRLATDDNAMLQAYGKASISNMRQNGYVTAVAAFAVIGALCFGIDQGLMSVILVMKQFQTQFPELADGAPSQGFHKGLVTALLELGAFVGAFAAPHISDHLSRRMAMRAGCTFFLVGAAVQAGAFNYDTIVAGRFVGGLGIGLLSSTMSVYISEIAPPNMRGMLLDLDELFVVLGIVAAYWACFGTRYLDGERAFRLPFGLQMVPGVLLLAGSFLMPPSPRWLAMKGRDGESLAVLARLRQRGTDDVLVQAEWLGMRAENRVAREVSLERHPQLQSGSAQDTVMLDLWGWVDTWRPGCWRRTLVSVLLCFFQQMVGINALIYYSPTIVAALGFSYDEQLVQSGIINVAQLAGVIISFFLIDRLGRRPLLVLGSIGMTVCMVIVGVLVKLFGSSWSTHQPEAKCALAFLNLYMAVFGVSWGPVPWAMPSELFSSSLRARGVAWSVMSNWLFNFIIGLIVPPMLDKIGWGTFIFFAAFATLAGVWTILCVPETKDKTLEQLDRLFNDDTGKHDEERRQRIIATLAAEFTGSVEDKLKGDSSSDSSSGKIRVERQEDV
ncbi:High-affinity glucose transporter [Cytospora mali]|uniref:High-affinity glucose transporter n=1 Tax=Cytospora mali TaxID=578113 RepID=A0A194VQD3_CYTMA|nr:High-affinity glucose transporter [Valsa mali]